MKNFNTNTDNHDEWLTPPEIIRALGGFDLDPCAPVNRPWDMASQHYTVMDNGLQKPWFGRVWCNPPYGRETFKWIEKLASHGSGIALIFARTETRGFHAQIWGKAHSVFFSKADCPSTVSMGGEGIRLMPHRVSCPIAPGIQKKLSVVVCLGNWCICHDQHAPQLPPRPQDGDALPLVHLRPHAGRCRTGAMPPVGGGREERPHLRCRAGSDDEGGSAWR